MKKNHFISIMGLLSLTLLPCFIWAQKFALDLSEFPMLNYELTGGSVNMSGNAGYAFPVKTLSPGVFHLQLSSNAQIHAHVHFTLDALGVISEVKWEDGNHSQTTGTPVDLSSQLFELSENDNRLKLLPQSVSILPGNLQGDAIEVELKSSISAINNLLLFPGDYTLNLASGGSLLQFETDLNGDVLNSLTLFNQETDAFENLSVAYYAINAGVLELQGENFYIAQQGVPDQEVYFDQDDATREVIINGATVMLTLLPGTYHLLTQSTIDNHAKADIRVSIPQVTGEISSIVKAKVLDEEATEEFEVVGIEIIEVSSDGKTLTVKGKIEDGIPVGVPSSIPCMFANLDKELDGGWYNTELGHLKFKYVERYNDSGDLDFTLYDAAHEPIAHSIPAAERSVKFGVNWYMWDLTSSGLSTGDFYILEVRNAKDDVSYLRFKYN